jgi:hypothetical protein
VNSKRTPNHHQEQRHALHKDGAYLDLTDIKVQHNISC